MCYGEDVPPLHFSGFHVACLCGDNGNGKSALLDAITWALWGKARARNDDDLIRLQKADMEVEFDFSVGSNSYRVLRKRVKAGLRRAGETLLDLQVKSADGFVSIRGNSNRETDQKITEILRMDYQTFVNSALLLQGRANTFSMKTPGERKEVLANVLGLSIYDELEKMARSCCRDAEVRARSLAEDLARIHTQLLKKPTLEEDLAKTREDLDKASGGALKQEQALNSLRLAREALRLKEEQHREVKKYIEQLQKQVAFLESGIKQHSARSEAYSKVIAAHEENSAMLQASREKLAIMETELGSLRERIEGLSNRIHYLHSSNLQLKKEMEELKSKLDLLAGEKAECPLCGTELGRENRRRIVVSYKEQGKEKGELYRTNAGEKKRKEDELNVIRQEAARLEKEILTGRAQCERRAEAVEREHREAKTNLPLEEDAHAAASRALDEGTAALREQIKKSGIISAELASLPKLEKDLGEAEREYRRLREDEKQCQDRYVETQAGLRTCARLEEEKREKAAHARLAAEEKGIYEELILAFGKKGIQAMLIESVLPEIQDDANMLLGRMTDNRMSVKIESQRDTKKGDTIETLDIRIADELGFRNYEMFSGGEAFRVDFALRIALSKLLARRAGAPLPTLIIDEGFGTQDSSGRAKLVDAIISIQDYFDKILVITHIDELKDSFPVRIEVTKTESGSLIAVE
ncbi:MAG: SMC family ATPase [Dehalococcoidia bacterium]|nr:SMC family ATPase [Dehalococcoidia bacterium]